jgi:hypothetical protein
MNVMPFCSQNSRPRSFCSSKKDVPALPGVARAEVRVMSDWVDLIEGVRRRRHDAVAQHAAELAYLDAIEAMIVQAAALRDQPAVEPVQEITWTEIWQNHPAAQDFFAQRPDAFAEERLQS